MPSSRRETPTPAHRGGDGQLRRHRAAPPDAGQRRIRSVPLMAGDFDQVHDGYFQGWRDGYAQAINDVERVLDDQTEESTQ